MGGVYPNLKHDLADLRDVLAGNVLIAFFRVTSHFNIKGLFMLNGEQDFFKRVEQTIVRFRLVSRKHSHEQVLRCIISGNNLIYS